MPTAYLRSQQPSTASYATSASPLQQLNQQWAQNLQTAATAGYLSSADAGLAR